MGWPLSRQALISGQFNDPIRVVAFNTLCIGRMEPEATGFTWPSARSQNRSVTAVGKMRNSSSTGTLDYTVDDSTGSFPIPKLGASGLMVFSTTNGSSLPMASHHDQAQPRAAPWRRRAPPWCGR
jgi:hypothetical protein